MSDVHAVETLFERVQQFGPYPPGVTPVPSRIPGIAFFPGGAGLWGVEPGRLLPPAPTGGVMILGHNFDSESGFHYSLGHAGENLRGATWRNLLRLLREACVSPEMCFFTNVYMGLIAGNRAVGVFPGSRDPDFVRRCREFLLEQLRVMQPRVILTLGKEVIPVLAPLSPDLAPQWSDAPALAELDERGAALVCNTRFQTVAHPVAVAALTHPALRHLNIGRRSYCEFIGNAAEVEMVRDAVKKANPSTPLSFTSAE